MTQPYAPWWNEERIATLRELHAQGLCDREIAEVWGVSTAKVASKRGALKLRRNLDPDHKTAGEEWPPHVVWPVRIRFQDVTKDEARRISANAPPSAPFRKHLRHSPTGSSAAMCTTMGPPTW